jgi:hypothetical protein
MQLRKLIFMLPGFIIIVGGMAGCAYAKKDVVQVPCVIADTVSYAKDIIPILQNNCYSCHSEASNVSGVLLDNYNALKFYAQDGYLYGTISHLSGYNPMPEDASKLDDCTIALIKKWIDAGTPQ